jgi:hypothetical protein
MKEQLLSCVIVLLSAFVSIITMTVFMFWDKRKVKKDLEYTRIIKESVDLACTIALMNSENKFENYPKIQLYTSQCYGLIKRSSLSYKSIKVTAIKDEKYLQGLINEITSAPKEIQDVVYRNIAIIERVLILKRPIFHAVNRFKKNMVLRILIWIVNILEHKSKKAKYKSQMDNFKSDSDTLIQSNRLCEAMN